MSEREFGLTPFERWRRTEAGYPDVFRVQGVRTRDLFPTTPTPPMPTQYAVPPAPAPVEPEPAVPMPTPPRLQPAASGAGARQPGAIAPAPDDKDGLALHAATTRREQQRIGRNLSRIFRSLFGLGPNDEHLVLWLDAPSGAIQPLDFDTIDDPRTGYALTPFAEERGTIAEQFSEEAPVKIAQKISLPGVQPARALSREELISLIKDQPFTVPR